MARTPAASWRIRHPRAADRRALIDSAGVAEEVAESGFGDEGVGEGEDEGEVVVGEFIDGGELVAEGVLGGAEASAGASSTSSRWDQQIRGVP